MHDGLQRIFVNKVFSFEASQLRCFFFAACPAEPPRGGQAPGAAGDGVTTARSAASTTPTGGKQALKTNKQTPKSGHWFIKACHLCIKDRKAMKFLFFSAEILLMCKARAGREARSGRGLCAQAWPSWNPGRAMESYPKCLRLGRKKYA